MSQQAEARSWWADVEHLRDAIEERRATTPEESMDARYERVHRQERQERRRTVQITGRPVSSMRLVEVERRRPPRTPIERLGPRPDRIAMWAVLLGIFCCIVALTTAHP
jgi:LPS O-antigen subunit length determinant protein (WzzB/FepE family)